MKQNGMERLDFVACLLYLKDRREQNVAVAVSVAAAAVSGV